MVEKLGPDVINMSELHPTLAALFELRLHEVNFYSTDMQLPDVSHWADIRFRGEPGTFDPMVDWGPELQDRGISPPYPNFLHNWPERSQKGFRPPYDPEKNEGRKLVVAQNKESVDITGYVKKLGTWTVERSHHPNE